MKLKDQNDTNLCAGLKFIEQSFVLCKMSNFVIICSFSIFCIQWRIQDFPEGAPTYYLANFLQKTAEKGSVFCAPLDPPLVYLQWRIQDFHRGANPQGAPGYNFIKISQKCMKSRKIWFAGGEAAPAAPPRSATDLFIHP